MKTKPVFFFDGFIDCPYIGRKTFYATPILGVAKVSLSWLLNNARHFAQGREGSPEKIAELSLYFKNANDRLCDYEDRRGKTQLPLLSSVYDSIDLQAGSRLAKVALEVVKQRDLAVSPSQYVTYTVLLWFQKPQENGFVQRMLEDIIVHNFELP